MSEGLVRQLGVAEAILRARAHFFDEIRKRVDLPAKIRAMIVASVAFLALYGAVIGSSLSPLQALSSAIKLPALFLITSLICLPTLYFFNALFGSKQSLRQILALILIPITVSAVLIFSFAPITLFFLLTTNHYQFFKLLNVAFFAIAGVIGMWFLAQGMHAVSGSDGEGAHLRQWTTACWIVVYAFVGSQMAWTLRPFIGYPGAEFEIVRQLGGNFYLDILGSMGEVLGFLIIK
ncbi:MAG: actin-binding WH2 domain-containing protein [Chloroflexi bacterium]|nr:MAG: actin-binding WH2 domain-containing protein [Chloroflexota bacterium]